MVEKRSKKRVLQSEEELMAKFQKFADRTSPTHQLAMIKREQDERIEVQKELEKQLASRHAERDRFLADKNKVLALDVPEPIVLKNDSACKALKLM